MYSVAAINEGTLALELVLQATFVTKIIGVADPTGFEPAISALTGPRVGPLHYGSNSITKDTANGDSMVEYTPCQQGAKLVRDGWRI